QPVPFRTLHSFPTRRSSDLVAPRRIRRIGRTKFCGPQDNSLPVAQSHSIPCLRQTRRHNERMQTQPSTAFGFEAFWNGLKPKHKDRKSTRLNSSHVSISYAV